MNNNEKLAQLLFSHITKTPEDYESMYPSRNLPEGTKVTRMAPSPTGFMHLGNLFGAVTDERLAHQSGGIFYLRIEDTDQKREVEDGIKTIISAFEKFGLNFDEGATLNGDNGNYGPYQQSKRAEIYQCFAKQLVLQGKAYPCFCTEDELTQMREQQEKEKANFGYYGKWAKHRDMSFEEIEKEIAKGTPYVLRFRSEGNPEKHVYHTDMIKGKMEFPENDQDIVILKSDGIPTYHFAHIIDDHLMRTTHVVRGEEWLATLPVHIQLFAAMGWKPPKYCHTAQLMKMDGESKRKLSKRKDPELALDFYHAEGYPVASVLEYLLTLLNSNFEEWRLANPKAPINEFKFTTNKMSVSGSLFDIAKLNDVSKNVISVMTADEVFEQAFAWAKEYDVELYKLFDGNKEYAKAILNIDRENPKPRKDIAKWSEVKSYVEYFYSELFDTSYELPENITSDMAKEILENYVKTYNHSDSKEEWFARIKEMCPQIGYTPNVKEYKKTPELFKGHVGDVSTVIRLAVTGRRNTPDLYEIMQLIGKEETIKRLTSAI